jgi:hypothetical protein
MNDEIAGIIFMAIRELPGRVGVEQAAKLLGFNADDMTILMGEPRLELKPLGNPAPNAPKYFSTVQLIRFASNPDWLDKASNAIRRHHLAKRKASNRPSGGIMSGNDPGKNLQRKLQQTTAE